MLSQAQNIRLHQSAAAWNLSRAEYAEVLMEATSCASSKEFQSQGQFEIAMAALEDRAHALGSWQHVRHSHEDPHYWRKNLMQKGGGGHALGGQREQMASSAQQYAIQAAMKEIRMLHPGLKSPEMAARYLASVMKNVTKGEAILQSALTMDQARKVVGALKRSVESLRAAKISDFALCQTE